MRGGALAATADNDGDTIASSIIRDRGGRDSLQVEALERAGKQVDKTLWNDTKSYIMYRGLGANQFWEDKVYKTMHEDVENALNNTDIRSITKNRALDGKIFAEFNVSPNNESIKQNRAVFEEFLQNQNLDETSKTFVQDADTALQNISDSEARQRYKNALIFETSFARTEVGGVAKARKLAIGEANIPLFRLRTASELAIANMAPDAGLKRNVIQQTAEIIEQEVISSKKRKRSVLYGQNRIF